MKRRALRRIAVNMLLDAGLAAVAAPAARYLADPGGGLLHPLWFIAGGAITLVVGGLPFGLQFQYWRFAGLSDLVGIAAGSVLSAALFSLVLVATGFPLPTVTFPAIQALTLLVLLGTPRILYRLAQARQATLRAGYVERVLLVGADEAADRFLRAIALDRRLPLRVDGLLAFGGHQPGRRIHGRRIVGRVDQAGDVLARLVARNRRPDALVVTDPDWKGADLARLIGQAERYGVAVRRAAPPTATEASGAALAPVAIEDLLNRPEIPLDRDGMRRLVAGRRVLVTGAGGSIGGELSRQVAGLAPACLVLLDQSEFALWSIDQELGESEAGRDVSRVAVIADVRDRARLLALFDRHGPELVFHAAALKHVPMVEANPAEGLLTNACGTRNVADACLAAGTRTMVMISTDKAVNPSSLMGASKRLAEMYCQGFAATGPEGRPTRFVTVRFGNVLGSTGSVVTVFRRQLERGGPLTVTHPDMRRYFMTVTEAVGLVLQASVVGGAAGTEEARRIRQGGIFVLDMGIPIRIDDLARQMIRLAGLRPEQDVRIVHTGLRPGEKLFEELFHGQEPPLPTRHPGLLMATPRTVDHAIVAEALDAIEACCRAGDLARADEVVARTVPEYRREAPPDGAPASAPGPRAAARAS